MKSPLTTISVHRETSQILDNVAKLSGLSKYQLADTAIRYFFDPSINPTLDEALLHLRESRKQLEENLLLTILTTPRAEDKRYDNSN